MHQKIFLLLMAISSTAHAETMLGIKWNPSIQKNEIYEVNISNNTETLLLQFEFPSGSWVGNKSFTDPKSGLLYLKDGDGATLVYSKKTNSITTIPASTTNSFQAYFPNVEPGGTEDLITSSDDGEVVLDEGGMRLAADGTVHIGENSIVLADELVSSSGNDEIYSSSDVLQLGDDENHTTVVVGNLEVGTPTAENHAVNKAYADTQDAATLQSAKTYANGVAAMAMAASQISMNVDPNVPFGFGIGFGNIGNQSAFSIGFAGADKDTGVRYSITGSYNEGTGQSGVGAGLFIPLR